MKKDAIVAEIRRQFDEWRLKWMPDLRVHTSCFYHAVFAASYLKENHPGWIGRVLISGGSASFQRVRPEMDDGVIGTHFSYVFEPRSADTLLRLCRDSMPEMHVWVQLPDRREILDLTTCYLKKQCIETAGLPWLNDDPPDYFWGTPEELPFGWRYTAQPEASVVVAHFYKKTWGGA